MTTSNLMAGLLVAGGLAACGAGETNDDCSNQPGTICRWMGGHLPGTPEDGTHRLDADLSTPADLTFGPDGLPYVVNYGEHRIIRVSPDGASETVMGNQFEGDGAPDDADLLPYGDPAGAPGPTVSLNHPTDVEFLPDGRLLLAAWHNNKLRALELDSLTTTVLTGTLHGFTGDGGPAYQARLNQPEAVAIDCAGDVWMIDQKNVRIRKLVMGGAVPTIDTVAGAGVQGYSGDGGPALAATFGFDTNTTPHPTGGLVFDQACEWLYIADTDNHRIRRIDLASGMIECIAGDGEPRLAGDGGPGLEASFRAPNDLELSPDGATLWVADTGNNAIRTIDLTDGAFTVATVAGNGLPCDLGDDCTGEDNQPARETQLDKPHGIAFDPTGDLFIADTNNNRIVKLSRP